MIKDIGDCSINIHLHGSFEITFFSCGSFGHLFICLFINNGWVMGFAGVCAMVSTVNCVRLMNHRPVPLKQTIHYMLKKSMGVQRSSGLVNTWRYWESSMPRESIEAPCSFPVPCSMCIFCLNVHL